MLLAPCYAQNWRDINDYLVLSPAADVAAATLLCAQSMMAGTKPGHHRSMGSARPLRRHVTEPTMPSSR